MTGTELRNYLDQYLKDRESIPRLIDANKRAAETMVKDLSDKWLIKDIYQHLEDQNGKIADKLEKKTVTVTTWAQLIDDQEHRNIYIDRFLKGMTWQKVAKKHNYSRVNVFRIYDAICDEIIKKTIPNP